MNNVSYKDCYFDKLMAFYTSKWLIRGVIGFGVVCRVTQYLANRSLRHDEAVLALNLLQSHWTGLFKPLDYNQFEPIGFLLTEKLAIIAFGTSEYALRLFPLLCGIASIFLFYRLATLLLEKGAVPLAVLFFVIIESLIFFSSDIKRYSSDVAIAEFLLLIWMTKSELSVSRNITLGIIGAVAIWFSPPLAFILASIGIVISLTMLITKQWSVLGKVSITFTLWLVSFAIYYKFTFVNVAQNQYILDSWWKGSFMPFPPNFVWLIHKFVKIFWHPELFGFPRFASIAAILALLGATLFFKHSKKNFYFLVLPIIITLFASALHKYPFEGRFILFLLPIFIILLTKGICGILVFSYRINHLITFVGIFLLGTFLFQPLSKVAPCVLSLLIIIWWGRWALFKRQSPS